MTTSPQAPPDFTVNGYRLLTRLGEGGMGVVHLAQRPGEPRVALKVIRPHIVGDDEARARLAREVGSLERIRSPRIAEIVDADPFGDIPYVATRYVPGLTLHEHVKQEGPVTGADLVHLARCLAEGVAAVHAGGVLHRDVKPSNVLLEGRSPVLIDFGLARVADDPRITHTGWLLGTPGFLAPEILHGRDATTASDVHSWAATVASAGLGRPPFGRGPGMAIMDRVRRGEHDLDGLPGQLRSLLADCLEPEPEHRPTLAEVLDELGADLRPPAPTEAAPFTVPLAVAAVAPAREVTEVEPPRATLVDREPPGPVEHWMFDDDEDQWDDRWDDHWDDRWSRPVELGEPVPPLGERLRRGGLVLLLALVVTGAVAAAPWVAMAIVAVAVWLMRSGSLAASRIADRRRLRGLKWYDGAQLVLSSPWHLVQSIPSTVVLLLWGAGMAAAGALVGYAIGATTAYTLAGTGLLLAIGVYLGPGGSRVHGPVGRVVTPLSRRPATWVVASLLTAAAAGLLGGLAIDRGVSWAPFQDAPFSGVDVGGITGR